MAKKFTDFNLQIPLLSSDYLVGYKADGSEELRTTVDQILNLNRNILVNSSDPALQITQLGSGDALKINNQSNDLTPFVVNNKGQLIMGAVSAINPLVGIQLYSDFGSGGPNNDEHNGNILLNRANNTSTTSNNIRFQKSRGSTANPITVINNERLGGITFAGYLSSAAFGFVTNTYPAAEIAAFVDQTPSPELSSVPGRLIFSTTASGNNIPTDRLIIDSNGLVTVNGILSSSQIVYSKELDFGSLERPSLTGIKQALNSFLYVSPALSYVRINGSSSQTLEVGQALTAPSITWNSNKVEPQAVSQYILTLGNGSTSTGSFTFSSFNDPNTYNITTIGGTATEQTSSWSVRVTDWAGAQATGTVSANWRYRVYYGSTNQENPNSAQILTGTEESVLATSRLGLGQKTVTPSNEYFFVAYPQRFGTTSQLKVNGLNSTSLTLISIGSFTNQYGGTADYYVYRSDNTLTSTYTIEII
jgi:hypothetical protein